MVQLMLRTGLYGSVNHHGGWGDVQLLRALLYKGWRFLGGDYESANRAAPQHADHQGLEQQQQEKRAYGVFHGGTVL